MEKQEIKRLAIRMIAAAHQEDEETVKKLAESLDPDDAHEFFNSLLGIAAGLCKTLEIVGADPLNVLRKLCLEEIPTPPENIALSDGA